jgi:hypothetical protein
MFDNAGHRHAREQEMPCRFHRAQRNTGDEQSRHPRHRQIAPAMNEPIAAPPTIIENNSVAMGTVGMMTAETVINIAITVHISKWA